MLVGHRVLLRTAVPAAFLLCALAGCVTFVGLYVQNDSVEAVLLQRGGNVGLGVGKRQQQLTNIEFKSPFEAPDNGIKYAGSPIKKGDRPPYGESLVPPDSACDIQKLNDCLGALQADKRARPHAHNIAGGDLPAHTRCRCTDPPISP